MIPIRVHTPKGTYWALPNGAKKRFYINASWLWDACKFKEKPHTVSVDIELGDEVGSGFKWDFFFDFESRSVFYDYQKRAIMPPKMGWSVKQRLSEEAWNKIVSLIEEAAEEAKAVAEEEKEEAKEESAAEEDRR